MLLCLFREKIVYASGNNKTCQLSIRKPPSCPIRSVKWAVWEQLELFGPNENFRENIEEFGRKRIEKKVLFCVWRKMSERGLLIHKREQKGTNVGSQGQVKLGQFYL